MDTKEIISKVKSGWLVENTGVPRNDRYYLKSPNRAEWYEITKEQYQECRKIMTEEGR